MKKRVEVFYSGRVQGVGFRYTAEGIAGNFAVTGFVRNLGDGRVQMTAEGEERDLADFLQVLEERMRAHIRDRQVAWDTCRNEFKRFEIRF